MKIGLSLLTVELDRLGGLNLRLAKLIRGLAEAGHEVITIQTRETLNKSQSFYRSVKGLPVKPLKVDFYLGNGLLRWARRPVLWCLPIGRLIPDDIDVLDLWDPLVNVPRQRSYRIVFSHNHFAPYIWEHLRWCGPRSAAMLPEIPFLYGMLRGRRRADGYVVVRERQRQWLVEKWGIPQDSVVAAPPGFDADLIRSVRQSAVKNTSPTIVFSGRLDKWKGAYELWEAFSFLAHEYPRWNLHFIGDGLTRAGLQEKVREKGLEERVVFWGRKTYDQALRIVASADIFALPSYIETFGMSLLEAMALGVPSIATDVGGVKDHMIEDEITGLLIPPKDPQALYQALVRLLADSALRRVLGTNGQEKVKDLTFERMVKSTSEFYAQLVST